MSAPNEAGTIVVSGTGRVAVEPDVAELRLGVAVSRDTVAEARSEAARAMTAIIAAVGPPASRPDVGHPCCRSSPATTTATARRRRSSATTSTNVVEVTVRDRGHRRRHR